MFDHKPQEPLIKIAAEAPPESFETRVLRELAAISERLAKLEEERTETRLLLALVRKQMPYLPEASSQIIEKQIAPGVREMYLPSRTHEADLAGVDFTADDVMHYYTRLKFDSVTAIREIFGDFPGLRSQRDDIG
jgi:hypothetical protein